MMPRKRVPKREEIWEQGGRWLAGIGSTRTERDLTRVVADRPGAPWLEFATDREAEGSSLGGRVPSDGEQVNAVVRPTCVAWEAMDDRGKRKAGKAGFGSESRRAGDGLTQRGGNEAFGCAAGGRTGAEYGARLGLRSGACAAAGSGR